VGAVKTTLVRVTADHIARGKRSDCEACPIALALAEADPRHRIWDVGEVWDGVFHAVLMTGEALPLPPVAKAFVSDFDSKRPVRPFTFYVVMP